jgi:hypothetical protein
MSAQGAGMLRFAGALIVIAMMAIADSPARAVTPAEKMETCKFGADASKLTGGKRKRFLSRCMANTDAPTRAAKKQPPS